MERIKLNDKQLNEVAHALNLIDSLKTAAGFLMQKQNQIYNRLENQLKANHRIDIKGKHIELSPYTKELIALDAKDIKEMQKKAIEAQKNKGKDKSDSELPKSEPKPDTIQFPQKEGDESCQK